MLKAWESWRDISPEQTNEDVGDEWVICKRLHATELSHVLLAES